MARPESPFVDFTQLAPSTWYLDPPQVHSNGTIHRTSQPDLVVLSTWMSAAPKHITKYTNTYRKLYPQTPLLLLTNGISDILFRSAKYHKKNLATAVSVIRSCQQSNSNAKISLHLFSNGGMHHVCRLAELYRQTYQTPLPVIFMVLDSCPGRGTYGRSIAAMSIGLPTSLPLRLLALFFLHIICMCLWFNHHIIGSENVITRVRREINNPLLFPVGARRVYLYSKTDAMVGWEDVEFNANEAKKKGWDIQLVRFERSKHVGHIMEDSGRYWAAVQGVVAEK